MAIKLYRENTFKLIEEGTYLFTVINATENELGRIEITLENQDKQQVKTFFNLYTNKAKGEINNTAASIFSSFVSKLLHNWEIEEVELVQLIGKQIEADIVHSEYNEKKYANVRNFKEVEINEEEQLESQKKDILDLDSILG